MLHSFHGLRGRSRVAGETCVVHHHIFQCVSSPATATCSPLELREVSTGPGTSTKLRKVQHRSEDTGSYKGGSRQRVKIRAQDGVSGGRFAASDRAWDMDEHAMQLAATNTLELVHQIKSTTTVKGLQAIAQEYVYQFDPDQAVTLLIVLTKLTSKARLCKSEWSAVELILQLLLPVVKYHLPAFKSGGITRLVYALAHFGCPDRELLEDIVSISAAQISSFNADHLSKIIWGLGVLRHSPSAAWMRKAVLQCDRNLGKFNSYDLALVMDGLALLQYIPGRDVVHSLVYCARRHFSRMTPSEMVRVLNAVRVFGHDPGLKWMQDFFLRSTKKLSGCHATELAVLVQCVEHFGGSPSRPWREQLLKQAAKEVEVATDVEFVTIFYGLAKLQVNPSTREMDCFIQELDGRWKRFVPHQVAVITYSLALLPENVLDLYVRQMVTVRGWISSQIQEVTTSMAELTIRELVQVMYASTRARVDLTPDWVTGCLVHVHDKLDQANLTDLRVLAEALVLLRAPTLNSRWWSGYLQRLISLIHNYPWRDDVVLFLIAFARLGLEDMQEVDELVERMMRQLGSYQVVRLARIVRVLEGSMESTSPRWYMEVVKRAKGLMAKAATRSVGRPF